MEVIGFIFWVCFVVFIISALAPFMQIRLYEINPDLFSKIKIKRFSFLFRGVGGKTSIYGDVQEYGIVLPLFILQVLGYVIASLVIVTVLLLLYMFKLDLNTIAIIVAIIMISYSMIAIATTAIVILISKKRAKNK